LALAGLAAGKLVDLCPDMDVEASALALDIVANALERYRKLVFLKVRAVVERVKCVVCESVKFDLHVSYSVLPTLYQ
jgi:hypothetical protein